ncbi:hypothetical protein HZS_3292 [Henneguya salminicola]|nr:hypothetical protein HZS_3292 [Henneguya salminicola]
MKGEKKSSLCYDAPINAVAHDSENKHYVIFMDEFISRVDYDYDLIEKVKAGLSQDILEAYVNGNQIYFIKKNGVFFEKKAFYNNHITCGYFHFSQKTDDRAPCHLAHCDIFCLTTSSISYECDCPNNMCVCDASHPDCTACKSNEYHCKNQKCVPMSNRCNGVDNCGDSSDEQNCKMSF